MSIPIQFDTHTHTHTQHTTHNTYTCHSNINFFFPCCSLSLLIEATTESEPSWPWVGIGLGACAVVVVIAIIAIAVHKRHKKAKITDSNIHRFNPTTTAGAWDVLRGRASGDDLRLIDVKPVDKPLPPMPGARLSEFPVRRPTFNNTSSFTESEPTTTNLMEVKETSFVRDNPIAEVDVDANSNNSVPAANKWFNFSFPFQKGSKVGPADAEASDPSKPPPPSLAFPSVANRPFVFDDASHKGAGAGTGPVVDADASDGEANGAAASTTQQISPVPVKKPLMKAMNFPEPPRPPQKALFTDPFGGTSTGGNQQKDISSGLRFTDMDGLPGQANAASNSMMRQTVPRMSMPALPSMPARPGLPNVPPPAMPFPTRGGAQQPPPPPQGTNLASQIFKPRTVAD